MVGGDRTSANTSETMGEWGNDGTNCSTVGGVVWRGTNQPIKQTQTLTDTDNKQSETTNPTHTHTHTQAQTMQLEGGWVLLFWLQPIALYEQWDQVHARQRMAKATVWGGGGV